jgi:hypothetical protein
MTAREKLTYCYELAFYPPRLHQAWRRIQTQPRAELGELGDLLDTALLLHQALPEDGYASQRALHRLALYQAKARAFGMVAFLDNLRRHLGRPPLAARVVPGHMVRDIGLPPLRHGAGRA